MKCCDMKGYLAFTLLWALKKQPMTGAELAKELEKRRGTKPSPGTIYPVLKEMKKNGLISSDKGKKYSITKEGESELRAACGHFHRMFYDMHEMMRRCHGKGK